MKSELKINKFIRILCRMILYCGQLKLNLDLVDFLTLKLFLNSLFFGEKNKCEIFSILVKKNL
ncbi:hypothetical protein BpHYR1_047179 [Brachionus plicatilis]|uniref:Uncharacterized protein n=1 Tax=Brachionus plicatilis TaxID=10195 RepID=A0A3M7S2B7_BRAPC|nr:hypothetical protein BpHYR1_047179 [Brachionus plicatilis]